MHLVEDVRVSLDRCVLQPGQPSVQMLQPGIAHWSAGLDGGAGFLLGRARSAVFLAAV